MSRISTIDPDIANPVVRHFDKGFVVGLDASGFLLGSFIRLLIYKSKNNEDKMRT
jgi:hypothetical protein